MAIDNTGIKKELSQRICNYLIDLNMLDKANDDRKDAEKDDDDDNDDDNDEINEEEAEEVNEDKDKDGEMNWILTMKTMINQVGLKVWYEE